MKHINMDFLLGIVITVVIFLIAIIIAYLVIKPFEPVRRSSNKENEKNNEEF